MWIEACKTTDLADGRMQSVVVSVFSVEIMVYQVGDDYFASLARCPHGDISLGGGTFNGLRVTCPGHGFSFNVQTGQCDAHKSFRLQTLPTKVDGGRVLVELTATTLLR